MSNQEEQLHILRDALISVIAMLSSVQADCQERCSALRRRQATLPTRPAASCRLTFFMRSAPA